MDSIVYPDSVSRMISETGAPTAPLDAFVSVHDADRSLWWRVPCGHHLNLFDEACTELDAARLEVARLRRELIIARTAAHDG